MGLPQADLDRLRESEEFQKRILILNFINGKIYHLSKLYELTKDWSDTKFDEVWKHIQEIKIGERPVDHNMMKELKKIRQSDRPQEILENMYKEAKPYKYQTHVVKTDRKAPEKPVSWFKRIFS